MAGTGFFTFLVCLVTFCGQPFDVLQSTSQQYTAGRQESGKGVNYKVQVVVQKSSPKLSFKSLTVNGEELAIKIQNNNKQFVTEFAKGDTLTISASGKIHDKELNRKVASVYLNYQFKNKTDIVHLSPEVKESQYYK